MHLKQMLVLATMVVACNRLTIQQGATNAKTPREAGDVQELTHIPTTGWTHFKGGFFIVDDAKDWGQIWQGELLEKVAGTEPRPPVPADIEWSHTMAFVAASHDPDATAITIDRVVRTKGDVLHVYVNQEVLGDKCEKPPEPPKNVMHAVASDTGPHFPADMVTLPKSTMPVVVHMDTAKASSCDDLPVVELHCTVAGAVPETTVTIPAQPGQSVECEGSKVKTKIGFIAERNWYFERRPADSFVRLTVAEDHLHSTFVPDAFGEYRLRMEAVDDRQKRGEKTVTIEVAPAQGLQVVQVGWTMHDQVDPAKLAKLEIHAIESPSGKDCTDATPQPPWCEIKTVGSSKQVMLHKNANAQYRLVVKYLEDRAASSPVLCVRTFLGGSTAALETCDFKERDAGAKWELPVK